MHDTTPAVLLVEEQEDEEGDIVWTLVAKTHDRRALDTLAEALHQRLRIIVAGTQR